MQELKSIPRSQKLPPVYLFTEERGVEKPKTGQILDELHQTVIAPFRVVAEILLLECDWDENIFSYSESRGALCDMMFGCLKRYEQLHKYL